MTPLRDTRWQDGVTALAKAAGSLVFVDGAWPCWRAPADFDGERNATIGDECMRYAVEAGIVTVTARDAEGNATQVRAS